jgi:hypothetical protein
MKRMGLVPGANLMVEPGARHASLAVRIEGREPSRLSRELASGIMVAEVQLQSS